MRTLVCGRPGDIAIFGPAAALAGAGSGLGAKSAAPAFAAPISTFSKALIRSSNIRASSDTNCRARWRRPERGPRSRSVSRYMPIPYLACGLCVACRRGKTNCCQRIGVLGVHIDGGMADYVCVPETNVAPADGVTLDQAAMIEFLAIGAHAVRRASPRKDDRILVAGAGPIGIGCMLFAKLQGGSVTALDIRRDRLELCRHRLGVDHAVAAGPNAAEALSALTSGDFFDVVIDATGNVKSMMAGLNHIRPWGNLRSGQRRARHDLLRRPRIPQARDLAARQPQRHTGGFRQSVRCDPPGSGSD